MSEKSASADTRPILPRIPFKNCPIRASLGSLGHKWTFLVLRDIAFLGNLTFGQIMRNNAGLTPRVLSMRLRDLRREGVIERVVNPEDERDIQYRLTAKGKDIIPILTAFIQYGARHHAEVVFEDEEPRDVQSIFPGRQNVMLGRLVRYAQDAERRR